MRDWLGFALVVFSITVVVSPAVMAAWPTAASTCYTSAVVAAATVLAQ
ncbi:MAG TPA: hypothetical protein VE569_06185 [Acidimicrobiia bacterium]|nr:hypothetical protein [Acidimicrobiia bacterium]